MSTKKGLVYIFSGEGKGKTSAALGMVVRAMGNEMKVGWVSWYKEDFWSESAKKLKIKMHFMGKGFYKLPTDKVTPKEHKQAAYEALGKAEELLSRVELLVMDEVVKAVADKLIGEKEVMRVVKKRGKTHIVLTGRGLIRSDLFKIADLVTECKKIKHPFDKGIKAVKGLDY
jgi:cob(I)alamin adenosyltransferase